MFDNGRKNVCVILCDVAENFQEQVCRTLTSYALKKGFNLAYFTFFLCYGVDTKNGRGEANIINLVPYENFDGFIICHDTFQNQKAVEQVFEYIRQRTKVPVITLRRQRDDYPCVLADNRGGIKKIVQHFVDHHGFQRIAIMSGPKDHPDAIQRLEDYKEGLESRGLSYDERMVFYGNFWRDYAKEAARYFVMEQKERPQAIVCSNDYMAIALCNELINMGIVVPDDIAISGFDDLWEASTNMPPITTVTMPVEKMSEMAFQALDRMMNGEEVEKVQTVMTEPVIRNSCGCKEMDMGTMLRKRVRQTKEQEKILNMVQNNTYMFVEMSEVNTAEELVEHVRLLDNDENFVRNFFICLGEGEGKLYPKYRSTSLGYPKKTKAIGGAMNRRLIRTKSFLTSDLLPPEATEKEPMIYYFFPVHNLNQTFGYFAVSYFDVHSCEKTFHSWVAILGNAVENLRLRQETNNLLEELNSLYVHDALTSLFNRRGFENSSREYYSRIVEEDKSMALFSIDMDNLKIVNDKFGHMQGDVALKTIARAMEDAARGDDVCARIGGDEFAVVGLGYDEESAGQFVDKFNQSLAEFNESSGLPYLVNASCGYYIIEVGEDISLDTALVESDNRLYENKREKKAKKQDIVLREPE